MPWFGRNDVEMVVRSPKSLNPDFRKYGYWIHCKVVKMETFFQILSMNIVYSVKHDTHAKFKGYGLTRRLNSQKVACAFFHVLSYGAKMSCLSRLVCHDFTRS